MHHFTKHRFRADFLHSNLMRERKEKMASLNKDTEWTRFSIKGGRERARESWRMKKLLHNNIAHHQLNNSL